jgi:23S rRNA (cytidine2498-2'-O)-methyltransferase
MNVVDHTAYLAPPGFEKQLVKELKDVSHVYDRLVLAQGQPQHVYFVQNIWYEPQIIPIDSIGHAAKTLRAIQRNWWPFAYQHFRRMKLISEKLPYFSPKRLDF